MLYVICFIRMANINIRTRFRHLKNMFLTSKRKQFSNNFFPSLGEYLVLWSRIINSSKKRRKTNWILCNDFLFSKTYRYSVDGSGWENFQWQIESFVWRRATQNQHHKLLVFYNLLLLIKRKHFRLQKANI